jgi:hypothetical protein
MINQEDIIPIIPGNAISDYMIVLLIPVIITLIVYLLGPYIAIFLFKLHRIIKLKRYDYFLIRSEKKLTISRMIVRSLFPGLFAINIAIYISLYGEFNKYFVVNPAEMGLAPIIEWISMLIGIPIAILIIIPIWMLEDSGLMCSLKLDKYKTRISPDIESTSRFYASYIKGYTGISTITGYALILYSFYLRGIEPMTYVIIFIDPLAIMFMLIFPSLVVEMKLDKIRTKMIAILEKKGLNIIPQTIKIEAKQ